MRFIGKKDAKRETLSLRNASLSLCECTEREEMENCYSLLMKFTEMKIENGKR